MLSSCFCWENYCKLLSSYYMLLPGQLVWPSIGDWWWPGGRGHCAGGHWHCAGHWHWTGLSSSGHTLISIPTWDKPFYVYISLNYHLVWWTSFCMHACRGNSYQKTFSFIKLILSRWQKTCIKIMLEVKQSLQDHKDDNKKLNFYEIISDQGQQIWG